MQLKELNEKSIRRAKALWQILVIVLLNFLVISAVTGQSDLTASALSKMGSRGTEVRQIQDRLKKWGYYSGAVDGIFGSGTKNGVIKFQRKNGLTADGVAGPKTLEKLGLPTGSSGSGGSSGGSNSDLNLLARLISGEARGEPYAGQVAVAAVILNRVEHPSFPDTVAGVCYQSGAFDAVADGQVNQKPVDSAYRAAQDALNGWDPSGGAIYYYNPKTATNKWIRSRKIIATIGRHVFCS